MKRTFSSPRAVPIFFAFLAMGTGACGTAVMNPGDGDTPDQPPPKRADPPPSDGKEGKPEAGTPKPADPLGAPAAFPAKCDFTIDKGTAGAPSGVAQAAIGVVAKVLDAAGADTTAAYAFKTTAADAGAVAGPPYGLKSAGTYVLSVEKSSATVCIAPIEATPADLAAGGAWTIVIRVK